MYLVDYHIHPYGHGSNDFNVDALKKYIKKAKEMNINEIGFSDHDNYIDDIEWKYLFDITFEYDFRIKISMEFDYTPDKEEQLKQKITRLPFDYCIGSVHKIDNWEFDHPEYIDEYKKRDIDEVYRKYFILLRKAVLSGIFDVIGHFDLIKVFNYRPQNIDILQLVEPVLESIKKKDLVIEVNTNGLNKPVQEIYPSMKILKRAFELDIPVTLGSDAHSPQRVGEGIKDAASLLHEIGYEKIATFKNRKKRPIPLII